MTVDLDSCDFSAFVGDFGLTVTMADYAYDGRQRWRVNLYRDGEFIYSDLMTCGWSDRNHVLGSAVAFMTDYNICVDAGIEANWYNDPRCEYLGYLGSDIEESHPVYEDGVCVNCEPHVKWE
jgi:hypothetical protein